MMRTTTKISAFITAALFAFSCGGNEGILSSGKDTPVPVNAAPSKPPVEKELDAMRTAGFSSIYVVRRKDGGKLDADDRGIIKTSTAEANRRVASEDGVAVIIGTNTALAPDKLAALGQRFLLDSYVENAPANTNTNSQINK